MRVLSDALYLRSERAQANTQIASLDEQLGAEKNAHAGLVTDARALRCPRLTDQVLLAAMKKKKEDAIAELERKLKAAEAEIARLNGSVLTSLVCDA